MAMANVFEDPPVYIEHPLRVDWNGQSATTDLDAHIRQLLEQVLFTAPGERVNRPGFGSGIDRALFRPNSELLAETTRATAEASIQQWLGHLIELISLSLTAEDNVLTVDVAFARRGTGERELVRFARAL
jgi:phage baseplate assembly protein W